MARNRSALRPGRLLWLAVGLAGLALALGSAGARAQDERPEEMPYETPGEFPLLDPSYKLQSHKVVLITDHALNPRRVELESGDLVAWISYAKQPSVVVFERETARDMICHSLVNFTITDDEIRSQRIHAGEFASFCQLKPGRYKYKVVRPEAGEIRASSAKRLEGEIFVKPEPEGEGAAEEG